MDPKQTLETGNGNGEDIEIEIQVGEKYFGSMKQAETYLQTRRVEEGLDALHTYMVEMYGDEFPEDIVDTVGEDEEEFNDVARRLIESSTLQPEIKADAEPRVLAGALFSRLGYLLTNNKV